MKKNKVLGFMTLHYGKEFLRESLLSVRDHVDKMYIAHTKNPSHGFQTDTPCPDTEEEMLWIAQQVMGDKLIWESVERYTNEAYHRDARYKHAGGMDLILTIDADEVFEPKDIEGALQYAMSNKERFYGIKGYINFFRSFSWVCTDSFRPVRIEKPRVQNYTQNLECPLTIYHFSTCQSEGVMRYKYKIFGHANEIKKNYVEEKYYAWSPEKIDEVTWVHPTSVTVWEKPQPFDKNTLPDILKQHPNFNKELI